MKKHSAAAALTSSPYPLPAATPKPSSTTKPAAATPSPLVRPVDQSRQLNPVTLVNPAYQQCRKHDNTRTAIYSPGAAILPVGAGTVRLRPGPGPLGLFPRREAPHENHKRTTVTALAAGVPALAYFGFVAYPEVRSQHRQGRGLH